MNRDLYALADRWKPVFLTLLALNGIVSTALLVGGIRALTLAPGHRTLLCGALVSCIAFEVIHGVPIAFYQVESGRVMEEFMNRLQAAQASGGAGAPPVNPVSFMKAGVYIGVAFALAWVAVKLACYITGILYLRRPDTVTLYESPRLASSDSDVT
jgi:hypothetical protein